MCNYVNYMSYVVKSTNLIVKKKNSFSVFVYFCPRQYLR